MEDQPPRGERLDLMGVPEGYIYGGALWRTRTPPPHTHTHTHKHAHAHLGHVGRGVHPQACLHVRPAGHQRSAQPRQHHRGVPPPAPAPSRRPLICGRHAAQQHLAPQGEPLGRGLVRQLCASVGCGRAWGRRDGGPARKAGVHPHSTWRECIPPKAQHAACSEQHAAQHTAQHAAASTALLRMPGGEGGGHPTHTPHRPAASPAAALPPAPRPPPIPPPPSTPSSSVTSRSCFSRPSSRSSAALAVSNSTPNSWPAPGPSRTHAGGCGARARPCPPSASDHASAGAPAARASSASGLHAGASPRPASSTTASSGSLQGGAPHACVHWYARLHACMHSCTVAQVHIG
jgi:hypothetical protein